MELQSVELSLTEVILTGLKNPKRQPLLNEPDQSYNGAIWGRDVPKLTGANIPFRN